MLRCWAERMITFWLAYPPLSCGPITSWHSLSHKLLTSFPVVPTLLRNMMILPLFDNRYLYLKNTLTLKASCHCKTQASYTSKTATGKPFAQRWILECHRILAPALTLLSVGFILGRIGFTMPSWQAMFYRGHSLLDLAALFVAIKSHNYMKF